MALILFLSCRKLWLGGWDRSWHFEYSFLKTENRVFRGETAFFGLTVIGVSKCWIYRVPTDCGHRYKRGPPTTVLFSLLKDFCFIKPHFWLEGLHIWPLTVSSLTHHVILKSYSGKHLADISMVVNNREAGQEPIPDEIWNKGLGKKKECAEDKRRDGRKERKHLNSRLFIQTSPFGLCRTLPSFHLLPLPSMCHLQTTGFAEKMWSHRLSSPRPWQLASRAGTWPQKRLWAQPLGCRTDHHMHSWKSISPPITHHRSSCTGQRKPGKHGPSQPQASNYRPRNLHWKL